MDTLPPGRLPQIVGNYPLEAGLAAWGIFIGINTLLVGAPSRSIEVLPSAIQTSWSILMVLGSLNLIVALIIPRLRRSLIVARAMFLYGVVFLVYAIAVEVNTGWIAGGAVAALMLMLGLVCFLRARYLRQVYEAMMHEAQRSIGQQDRKEDA